MICVQRQLFIGEKKHFVSDFIKNFASHSRRLQFALVLQCECRLPAGQQATEPIVIPGLTETVKFSLYALCVLRCAHSYLRDLCWPVSVLAARRVLRSAAGRGELLVPRARLAIMQLRAFWVLAHRPGMISLLSCV